MKVIVPQFVGDDSYGDDTMAELLSSSVAASSESTYNPATTYSLNDVVKYQITTGNEEGIWKEFKSLQGSNTGNNPYSTPAYWSDQGATERWKMFDYYTTTATTDASNDIVVNLHCRRINSIGFLNVQADEIVIKVYNGTELADKIAGNLIDTITIDLTQQINDWMEYFFEDFEYIRDISTPVDISLYHNTVLEVTFSKITGIDCYVGQCLPGRSYYLGGLRYGAGTGIKDYSRKITDDDYGYTYLSVGNYKKMLDADIIIEKDNLNGVNSILTQLRATPTIWQGNPDDLEYDNLLVYGFCSDFNIIAEGPNHFECSLEIEGLI